jgi:hypothetical protein
MEPDTTKPNRYHRLFKCGKAFNGQQKAFHLVLWNYEQRNSPQIKFWKQNIKCSVLVRDHSCFGVKRFYFLNGQGTLWLITKSGIWTINMLCSRTSPSHCKSYCFKINFWLIFQFSLPSILDTDLLFIMSYTTYYVKNLMFMYSLSYTWSLVHLI